MYQSLRLLACEGRHWSFAFEATRTGRRSTEYHARIVFYFDYKASLGVGVKGYGNLPEGYYSITYIPMAEVCKPDPSAFDKMSPSI